MDEQLLTTAQVAERLAMSAEWVRDHAAELGAIRAGGPRAPLRFETASIEAWKERQRLQLDRRTPRPASRARRRRSSSGVELLPRPPRSLLTARS